MHSPISKPHCITRSTLAFFSRNLMENAEKPIPESVIRYELEKSVSMMTGLPSAGLITDPLTGLSVVNLHHASIPTETEEPADMHQLLACAGQAISPALWEHWEEEERK